MGGLNFLNLETRAFRASLFELLDFPGSFDTGDQ